MFEEECLESHIRTSIRPRERRLTLTDIIRIITVIVVRSKAEFLFLLIKIEVIVDTLVFVEVFLLKSTCQMGDASSITS